MKCEWNRNSKYSIESDLTIDWICQACEARSQTHAHMKWVHASSFQCDIIMQFQMHWCDWTTNAHLLDCDFNWKSVVDCDDSFRKKKEREKQQISSEKRCAHSESKQHWLATAFWVRQCFFLSTFVSNCIAMLKPYLHSTWNGKIKSQFTSSNDCSKMRLNSDSI